MALVDNAVAFAAHSRPRSGERPGVVTLRAVILRLAVVDAALIGIALSLAQMAGPDVFRTPSGLEYAWFTPLLVGVAWLGILRLLGSAKESVLGAGVAEYQRVLQSTLVLFVAIEAAGYGLDIAPTRGIVLVGLPVGTLLLLLGRRTVRAHIHHRRRTGHLLRSVVLIGSALGVRRLQDIFAAAPQEGYRPVGAIVPGHVGSTLTDLAVPAVGTTGDVDALIAQVERFGGDTVSISIGAQLDPTTIQHLAWELRDRNIAMILAPSLTEVAGPRIHIRPVAGLPLVHVSTPRLDGAQAAAKRLVDVVGAVFGLVVLTPFLAFLALLVRIESRGPALFHQERIGKDGEPFRMHKLRTMVADAEKQAASLMELNGGAHAFFKIKDDPRVTPLGAFLRKYSLDEFPQLWNVLTGEMSLVGPRPQVRAEVDTYRRYDHRRHMVKPGLTGLWQVSGRNDLSVEESVRLDLRYVENWSLTQDAVILVRTLRAVLRRAGAY